MKLFRIFQGSKNAPAAPPVEQPAATSEEATVTIKVDVEMSPEARALLQQPVPPVAGCKTLGTLEQPVKKVLSIDGLEVKADGGAVTIRGYANTKGKADRYGDIPTVFGPLRSYVYELGEFRKNPVMLIDHRNEVGCIAGSFKVLREDSNGLYFEAEFTKSDSSPMVAHARQVYAEGHGKALSISGRWFFEDKDNPDHLTYADIAEISLVGVGADPNALAATEQAVPAKASPCCYRHAGGVQKELPCASLEQVQSEIDLKQGLEALVAKSYAEDTTAALRAGIERLLAAKQER